MTFFSPYLAMSFLFFLGQPLPWGDSESLWQWRSSEPVYCNNAWRARPGDLCGSLRGPEGCGTKGWGHGGSGKVLTQPYMGMEDSCGFFPHWLLSMQVLREGQEVCFTHRSVGIFCRPLLHLTFVTVYLDMWVFNSIFLFLVKIEGLYQDFKQFRVQFFITLCYISEFQRYTAYISMREKKLEGDKTDRGEEFRDIMFIFQLSQVFYTQYFQLLLKILLIALFVRDFSISIIGSKRHYCRHSGLFRCVPKKLSLVVKLHETEHFQTSREKSCHHTSKTGGGA